MVEELSSTLEENPFRKAVEEIAARAGTTLFLEAVNMDIDKVIEGMKGRRGDGTLNDAIAQEEKNRNFSGLQPCQTPRMNVVRKESLDRVSELAGRPITSINEALKLA
jgi:hypothetical protein